MFKTVIIGRRLKSKKVKILLQEIFLLTLVRNISIDFCKRRKLPWRASTLKSSISQWKLDKTRFPLQSDIFSDILEFQGNLGRLRKSLCTNCPSSLSKSSNHLTSSFCSVIQWRITPAFSYL